MPYPVATYADGSERQWNGQEWVVTKPPGGVKGYDSVGQSAEMLKALAKGRAAKDLARLEGSQAAEKEGYDNEQTALRAQDVLDTGVPTGVLGETRMAAGKAFSDHPFMGKVANVLTGGFVPDNKQTVNLETMQTLGNTGALGQVGQLKGPLSDRDVQFIKSLQYSPNSSRAQNQRVIEAQKWVARRQAAYGAALRKWTENLGSPSALNGKGMSFDRFWGEYSARALPRPGLEPQAAAPTRNAFDTSAPAAPAKGGGGLSAQEQAELAALRQRFGKQ